MSDPKDTWVEKFERKAWEDPETLQEIEQSLQMLHRELLEYGSHTLLEAFHYLEMDYIRIKNPDGGEIIK